MVVTSDTGEKIRKLMKTSPASGVEVKVDIDAQPSESSLLSLLIAVDSLRIYFLKFTCRSQAAKERILWIVLLGKCEKDVLCYNYAAKQAPCHCVLCVLQICIILCMQENFL